MPQKYGFRNNSRKQKLKETHPNLVAEQNTPILREFSNYARELDDKHDRHERIVKLSRDITIESKRIIFLLHTIDARKNNKTKVLDEARTRLNKIIEVNFKAVAAELKGCDPYQFRWAYSPGLQEFIEAYSFMEYFQNEEKCNDGNDSNTAVGLSDWKAIQNKMQYEELLLKEKTIENNEDENETPTEIKPSSTEEQLQKFAFFVEPTEYILGISDLCGELMRRCINSLSSGETDVCLDTCKVLQNFYAGYISLNVPRCRELSRKIYTMRQSVLKAENVCYNVKVRGGEAAKWGAVFDSKPTDDVDEGYF